MPEPTENPNPAPVEDKTSEKIIAGVREGVKAAMSELQNREPARPAPVVQSAPAPFIARPSEEEIADALDRGDKKAVAELLRKQHLADRAEIQRELGALSAQGGAAISSMARTSASTLPYYKRFKKEIDTMVEQYQQANPSAMATQEVYERAHDIVRGQHVDELIAESREEAIRKAREPETPLEPTNDRGERIPQQPKSLKEVLKGDWTAELRLKNGRNGASNDETELRKLGWNSFEAFMADRKAIEERAAVGDETCGLDRDWVWEDQAKTKGHYIN
jgi:hypothetical protein